LIANGFEVRERICAIASLIASGAKEWAPSDPRPPKFDTAAVNFCDDSPPSGPWIRGYSIPSVEVNR
jgi:hypothetical protein